MKDPKTEFTYQYVEDTGCFREDRKFWKDILTTKPSEEIYFLKATPKSMDLSLLIDKHPKL